MSLALRQASILIIDDFQGMRTMLRDFLSSMGVATIDTASNGRDALQLLGVNKYDIVICDYNLGEGANGQQILEEAKRKNHVGVSTVWVMVTAEKTAEMVMGAAEIRPDDYLLKPISQALLESRLEKLLTRKQSLAPIEASVRALNYPEALAQCDQQLKANIINPHEVLRIKSELLLAMGDYEAAKALFESVLVSRDVAWAQTGLGKVLFLTRKYAQARDMFQSVLQQNEVFMEASDWLAKTCIVLGDHQTAQKVLQEAARLSPNSPTRQKLLGEAALKNGALDVARGAFEKTIRISEFSPNKSASAYTRLAKVLSEQGAPLDALKTLALCKKEFRYNTEASLQTAAAESVIYQDMGQTDRAQAAMQEAERLIDKSGGKVGVEVALEVADSLFKLGNNEKASSLLKEVVRNNHENMEISNSIAAIFEEHGLVAKGQALIAESRGEVVGINNEGVTLAKQGNLLAGANLLRTAAEKLPNNEVILINLCGLLIALLSKEGRNHQIAGEARELLDRVRQLNPSNRNYHVYTAALNRVMGTS